LCSKSNTQNGYPHVKLNLKAFASACRTVNSFELDVTYQPSVLVVSQVDYPGWKAYVDGNPVRMTRANYAFPAIFISPGPHHVRFSFEPWTFKVGLALTALAAVIVGFMAIPRRRHQS
jgi:uncharacterized membrane protein YfhO